MSRRNRIYWYSQIGGWSVFVLGNILNAWLSGILVIEVYFTSAWFFVFGLLITHVFRILVHRWGWRTLSVLKLIPRVLVSCIAMSAVFVLIYGSLSDLLLGENAEPVLVFENFVLLGAILNFSTLFAIWCLVYFAVHYFENLQQSEIRNLELRAAKTEIELNSFKAQMNPHFMFNSMNSIRALVDEDPRKAKEAITMLSGILRNTLMLGKKQLVTFGEELDMVKKYLAMEQIRFEERLRVHYEVDPQSLEKLIPPFMLQTIVENGVKHGISKLRDGGIIRIFNKIENNKLVIKIENTGKLGDESGTGIGLSNTRKRLELIYHGKASFDIRKTEDEVHATLILPLE